MHLRRARIGKAGVDAVIEQRQAKNIASVHQPAASSACAPRACASGPISLRAIITRSS
jgi:hypothetical protein